MPTAHLAKLTTEHMSQIQSNAAAGFGGAGGAAGAPVSLGAPAPGVDDEGSEYSRTRGRRAPGKVMGERAWATSRASASATLAKSMKPKPL